MWERESGGGRECGKNIFHPSLSPSERWRECARACVCAGRVICNMHAFNLKVHAKFSSHTHKHSLSNTLSHIHANYLKLAQTLQTCITKKPDRWWWWKKYDSIKITFRFISYLTLRCENGPFHFKPTKCFPFNRKTIFWAINSLRVWDHKQIEFC